MPEDPHANESDEALMKLVATGNDAAFHTLFNRYDQKVMTFCYSYLKDFDLATDIAQDAFLRVWRHAKDYQPIAKFTTWLYRIAANL